MERHHLFAGAVVLGLAVLASATSWAQVPTLEKSLVASEGRALRGVAFKDSSGDVFGVDAEAGRVFRWSNVLGRADLSTMQASFSWAIDGTVGDLAWASDRELLYVARGNRVEAFDPFGNRQEFFTPLGNGAVSGLAADGDRIYLTNAGGTQGSVFQRRFNGVRDVIYNKTLFAAGTRIVHGMAYDESRRRMWVSDDDRKIIMAFDDLLDKPDQSVNSPALSFNPGFVELVDMEFSQDLGLFFLCTGGADVVAVYNAQGQRVETFDSNIGFCAGVAAHGDRIWISDLGSTVKVFRRLGPNNYLEEGAFQMEDCGGLDPSLAYDPHRNLLWVWTWENNGFCALDPDTGAVRFGRFAQNPNNPGPFGHALTFAAGKLIEGTESGSLDGFRVWSIVDDVDYVQLTAFALPNLGPTGLAFNHDKDTLWAIGLNNGQPGDFFEFSPTNGQLLNRFTRPLGAPWGSGLSYGLGRLFQGTETANPDQVRVIRITCLIDSECGDGEICDRGQCVPGCDGDTDCPNGQICEDLRCQAGCTQDAQCPNGQICEGLRCEPGCRNDGACANGQICQGDQCVPGCRNNNNCPVGRVCEGNQCVPGCRGDNECNLGQICRDNDCVPGCRDDGACNVGQICRAEQCVPGCRDLDDDACPIGQICRAEQCVPGCRDDGACGAGEICDDDQCVPGCRLDPDCGDGEICNLNQCVPGCRNDRNCEGGEICLALSCVPGCRVDPNCGSGEICRGVQCVPGCRTDGGCDLGQICEFEQCVPGCREDEDCGSGQICQSDVCVPGCRVNTDCRDGEICEASQCVPACAEDGDCPLGEICEDTICVDGCIVDAECVPGEICDEGRCQPGCRNDNGCAVVEICQSEVCVPGCRTDGVCAVGQICVSDRCVLGCRTDVDCGDDQVCEGNRCILGCRTDEQCVEGQICAGERCTRGCRNDDQCGADEICLGERCIRGCRDDNGCAQGRICAG